MTGDDEDAASSPEGALARFLPESQTATQRRHHVTALLVAAEGSELLARCLAAFADQTRPADAAAGFDPGDLPEADPARSNGTLAACLALAQAEAQAPATRAAMPLYRAAAWYWILHEDVAAEPDCLAALLAAADRHTDAAILIPKAVAWNDPGRLVAVGHRWAPGSPLVEPLDPGERDQGQYDVERPVYAGDSAGMLVRADVWESLGGLDPLIGDWAAPADLCRRAWGSGHTVMFIPDAVVAHRRAHRIISADRLSTRPAHLPSARRLAREGQILLGLTSVRGLSIVPRTIALVMSTLLRCLALLLTREPEDAAAELAGAWDAISGRKRLRAVRARAWQAPVTDLRPPKRVRAPRGMVAGHAVESWLVATGLSTWSWRRVHVSRSVRAALTVGAGLVLASVLRNPGIFLGPGSVHGGALLPAPGAMELVRAYLDSWHDVRFGTSATVPTYSVALAALATPLLGSVDVLLRLMLGLAVPLAFLSARWLLGALDVQAKTWAALAYATLPAAVAATGSGRLGTLAVVLWGPVCARLLLRVLRPREAPVGTAVRPSLAAGAALGLLALFSPAVLLLAPVAIGLGLLRPALRVPLAWIGGVALAFALMWLPIIWSHPLTLVGEIGRDDPTLLRPAALPAAISPGGPGATGWIGIVLVAAALFAVSRPAGTPGTGHSRLNQRLVVLGLAALVALAWTPWPIWLGIPMLAVGALLILATANEAKWGDPRVHPVLRATAVLLLIGWWLAPTGALTTGGGTALPPLAATAGTDDTRARTLVLHRQSDGVHYAVATRAGPRVGDADALLAGGTDADLETLVGELVGGAAGNPVPGLLDRGIGFIVATTAPEDPLVGQVDAIAGLRRLATDAEQSLWLVPDDPTRARLTGAGQSPLTVPVRTSPTTVDVELDQQIELPRELRIAEAADGGWVAELAGTRLTVKGDENGMIRAAVEAPGWLLVRHRTGWPYLAAAHLGLLLVVLLIAMPKPRARYPDGDPT